MYRQFGWVDSPYYLALIVPTLFPQETYFVYMLIQFMRNIPRELDEAAKIDGCNIMQTLVLVLVPMLWPAMVSAGLFQFMWSSSDFMGPLYVNSPARYPATLFVRMSMDADTGFAWNRVMARSLISIIPSLVVFFLAQRQFMDGVTAGADQGLISLLLFFGGCQANKTDILRAKLSIWARKVSKGRCAKQAP